MQDPAIRVLAGACGLLGDACESLKLSRRDTDDPPKMKAEMALIREAGAERDLGQTELAVCPQEFLRSFNAARDHILVWRQPGGRLELPREVKGAEIDDGRHLFQRRTASEIFHDILNDPAELMAWQYAVGRRLQPAGTRDVTDQVNGQNRGE